MTFLKKYGFIIFLFFLFLQLNYCSPNYVLDKNGQPIIVLVKIDRNYDDLDKSHKINRDFLYGFMQDDIKQKFRKEDIKSVMIDNEKEIQKSDQVYLLNIKMAKYHAKRSSGRWGPGILFLEYNLYYDNQSLIDNKSIDDTSLRGGTYCAQKLDKMIAEDVSQKIKEQIGLTD